ncbi:MAG: TraR/DksA family transcriptional regulator [Betaproteobacteria bacterium]|nr:TraR/DksA family transcriptional regulator [Betaproteobacteria bacterium]
MSAVPGTEMASFREVLERRKAALVSEIEAKLAEARAARVAPDASAETDGGDRAVLDVTSEIDLATASRDIRELRDTEAALDRLAKGTFGLCESCGDAIALGRLRVYPTATRCAPCQSDYERSRGGAQGTSL